MRVALIIPALNEAEALPLIAPRIPAGVEVLVVDNGSSDETAQVAKDLGFRVVYESQRGYGAAVYAGMQASDADVLAFASADGSDAIERLPELLQALEEAALAMAVRTQGLNWMQIWGHRLICGLIGLRWGRVYRDLGPFRAIRKADLLALDMQDRGFGWTLEMQIKLAVRRLRVIEIPQPYARRAAGRSKISGTFGGTLRVARAFLWTFARFVFRGRI